MRVVSVAVGRPRDVPYRGRSVATSIYKQPVDGPVHIGRLGLAGDTQSDPRVHGGPWKAVYAYPEEHYEPWRLELRREALEAAQFGENLTIRGLLEDEACVGDRLRIGGALLQVTEPRLPCFKLGIRLGRQDALGRMRRSGRFGFYLAVVEEGELAAGDAIDVVHRDPARYSVARLARTLDDPPAEEVRQALAAGALPPAWRARLERRLAEAAQRTLPGMAAES